MFGEAWRDFIVLNRFDCFSEETSGRSRSVSLKFVVKGTCVILFQFQFLRSTNTSKTRIASPKSWSLTHSHKNLEVGLP